MYLDTANVLKEIIEDLGEECTVREDYSGRGMYGKETSAIVIDNQNLITMALARKIHSKEEIDSTFIDAMEELQHGFDVDNMGKDKVVIY